MNDNSASLQPLVQPAGHQIIFEMIQGKNHSMDLAISTDGNGWQLKKGSASCL
jgi:hypothetical protein